MRKALRTALLAVLVAASAVLATPASAQHRHGGHGSRASHHYGNQSYSHGYHVNPRHGYSQVRFSLGASGYYGPNYSYGYYGSSPYYDPRRYYDGYSYPTPYYGAHGQVSYRYDRHHRHHGHH